MRRWTDQQFIDAVQTSGSVRAVLIKLGLKGTGGNYKEFRRHCKRLGVTTAHFHGQGPLKGKKRPSRRGEPLDTILIENSTYINLHSLKRRLIEAGVLDRVCSNCKLREWFDKPIPLELDQY